MKIAVCGAGGRMGREVCKAVAAEADLELVCAVDPQWAGRRLGELIADLRTDLVIEDKADQLLKSGVEIMVDFSIAAAARENVPYALKQGIHCVVGTTGLKAGDLDEFARISKQKDIACLVAPNFAIGAVLMMDFARRASRYMQACEIIELHHAAKLDAPSGTSKGTARLILAEQGEESEVEREAGPRGLDLGGIHIHSVRLPGLVAHQEVIFGGLGQTLTIRHDSYDRTSFMPGVVLAVRKVSGMKGLVIGLEELLDL
ncbi:MAG: 4-hydroxy-tetrahydrodipicolinate reductase [Actinobacteria bacterium]|nr:4-hydroxy-tetrahydrodipicolinate reductase [Actinomycetota bacterium]